MESLPYSQLAYQLIKRHQALANDGLVVDIEENGNSMSDLLVLKHNANFKVYNFTTRPYLWDRYRQFCLHTTGSGRYHYRVNPTNDQPIRVQSDNSGYFSPTLLDYQEMPQDLREFADEIFALLQRIGQQLAEDKLNFDMHEPRSMQF